jgi:hypothetical protein
VTTAHTILDLTTIATCSRLFVVFRVSVPVRRSQSRFDKENRTEYVGCHQGNPASSRVARQVATTRAAVNLSPTSSMPQALKT